MTTKQVRNDHTAIRDVDPFGFQATHIRMAWLLRLSVMLNVVAVIGFMGSVSAIFYLMPLKEVRVALIKDDPRENITYRVEPISPETNGFQLMLEIAAKRFVKDTMTIDTASSDARSVSAIKYMTQAYANKFKREFIDSGWLNEALDSGLNRSIIIETVQHVDDMNPRDNIYTLQVDYIQIDARNQIELSRKPFRAFVLLTNREQIVKEEDLHENPAGIFVQDMSIKEIK